MLDVNGILERRIHDDPIERAEIAVALQEIGVDASHVPDPRLFHLPIQVIVDLDRDLFGLVSDRDQEIPRPRRWLQDPMPFLDLG